MEPQQPPAKPEVQPAGGEPAGPSDGTLVEQVLGGRRDAFDVLIKRYQRQAVAVSYRLLGNSHDALEVTQDAFLKGFNSLATLQKPEAFGGWLMRIVSNLSLNYRRSRKTRSQLPLDDLLGPTGPAQGEGAGSSDCMTQSGDPLHRLESQEMGKRLQQALGELPEKQRYGLTLWGLSDRNNYLRKPPFNRTDDKPLAFDDADRPKPMTRALYQALRAAGPPGS